MKETRINIGCGVHYAEGWINIDVHYGDDIYPDIVASVIEGLPFKDKTVDKIYAGHFLEHIDLDGEMDDVLNELKRVLSDDGEVMFVGPDLTRAEKDWPEMIEAIIPHEGDWHGHGHSWESREETILELLDESGWDATALPILEVPDEWPVVSKIGWQCAVAAKPKRE